MLGGIQARAPGTGRPDSEPPVRHVQWHRLLFLSEAPSGDATTSHAGTSGQLGAVRPLFPQLQAALSWSPTLQGPMSARSHQTYPRAPAHKELLGDEDAYPYLSTGLSSAFRAFSRHFLKVTWAGDPRDTGPLTSHSGWALGYSCAHSTSLEARAPLPGGLQPHGTGHQDCTRICSPHPTGLLAQVLTSTWQLGAILGGCKFHQPSKLKILQ